MAGFGRKGEAYHLRTVADILGPQKCVAVFASGPSLLRMGTEEVRAVKEKCFTVFMNYAMSRFGQEEMDVLAFGDWAVSRWMANGNLKPGVRLLTTWSAFQDCQPKDILKKVDAWIESSRGNFTLTNVLHDLRAMAPDRRILLFGVDMKVEPDVVKWYDAYTDEDRRMRGKVQDHARCFEAQRRKLALVDGRMVWNCNMDSALDVFEKAEWRNVVNGMVL